jgi:hypothetical protein
MARTDPGPKPDGMSWRDHDALWVEHVYSAPTHAEMRRRHDARWAAIPKQVRLRWSKENEVVISEHADRIIEAVRQAMVAFHGEDQDT